MACWFRRSTYHKIKRNSFDSWPNTNSLVRSQLFILCSFSICFYYINFMELRYGYMCQGSREMGLAKRGGPRTWLWGDSGNMGFGWVTCCPYGEGKREPRELYDGRMHRDKEIKKGTGMRDGWWPKRGDPKTWLGRDSGRLGFGWVKDSQRGMWI